MKVTQKEREAHRDEVRKILPWLRSFHKANAASVASEMIGLLREDLTCNPTYETLSRRTGIWRSGIGEAISELKSLGILVSVSKRVRRFDVNRINELLAGSPGGPDYPTVRKARPPRPKRHSPAGPDSGSPGGPDSREEGYHPSEAGRLEDAPASTSDEKTNLAKDTTDPHADEVPPDWNGTPQKLGFLTEQKRLAEQARAAS